MSPRRGSFASNDRSVPVEHAAPNVRGTDIRTPRYPLAPISQNIQDAQPPRIPAGVDGNSCLKQTHPEQCGPPRRKPRATAPDLQRDKMGDSSTADARLKTAALVPSGAGTLLAAGAHASPPLQPDAAPPSSPKLLTPAATTPAAATQAPPLPRAGTAMWVADLREPGSPPTAPPQTPERRHVTAPTLAGDQDEVGGSPLPHMPGPPRRDALDDTKSMAAAALAPAPDSRRTAGEGQGESHGPTPSRPPPAAAADSPACDHAAMPARMQEPPSEQMMSPPQAVAVLAVVVLQLARTELQAEAEGLGTITSRIPPAATPKQAGCVYAAARSLASMRDRPGQHRCDRETALTYELWGDVLDLAAEVMGLNSRMRGKWRGVCKSAFSPAASLDTTARARHSAAAPTPADKQSGPSGVLLLELLSAPEDVILKELQDADALSLAHAGGPAAGVQQGGGSGLHCSPSPPASPTAAVPHDAGPLPGEPAGGLTSSVERLLALDAAGAGDTIDSLLDRDLGRVRGLSVESSEAESPADAPAAQPPPAALPALQE